MFLPILFFGFFSFSSLSHDLISAIRNCDYEECKSLLNSGEDVNKIYFYDTNYFITPLVEALRFHHKGPEEIELVIIKLLLDFGADVNKLNYLKEPLLYKALRSLEITELFLQHGANINILDKDGKTLLHNPGLSIDGVKLLLEWGANPNIIDKYGRDALFYQASNGHMGIVRLLFANGGNTECVLVNDPNYSSYDFISDNKIMEKMDNFNAFKEFAKKNNITLPYDVRVNKINRFFLDKMEQFNCESNIILGFNITNNWLLKKFTYFTKNESFLAVPDDIWILVVSKLKNYDDLLSLMYVSKRFYNLVKESLIILISLDKKIRFLKNNDMEVPKVIEWKDIVDIAEKYSFNLK